MNLSYHHPMNAYAQASLETAAASADPHKLVLMLFDGAIEAVYAANDALLKHDYSEKGRTVSKAIAIIGELAASLNYDAGGELAASLGLLYAHMTVELLNASMENRPEGLTHVGQLLCELREGWIAIDQKQTAAVSTKTPSEATVAEPPLPHNVTVSYGKA